MIIRLAVPALLAGLLTSTAFGQARERVMDAEGNPVAPWVDKEVCIGPQKCAIAIVSTETGEVAAYGDKITKGFNPSGSGKEVVRGTAVKPTRQAATATASQPEKVLGPSGAPQGQWVELKTCLGAKDSCPRVVINKTSREVAILGDTPAPGFAKTGQGDEVSRASHSTPTTQAQ